MMARMVIITLRLIRFVQDYYVTLPTQQLWWWWWRLIIIILMQDRAITTFNVGKVLYYAVIITSHQSSVISRPRITHNTSNRVVSFLLFVKLGLQHHRIILQRRNYNPPEFDLHVDQKVTAQRATLPILNFQWLLLLCAYLAFIPTYHGYVRV